MEKNELADEIINEGVFPMCTSLSKLKSMAVLLYNAGGGPHDLLSHEMMGVGEILSEISDEPQAAWDKAHAIHKGKEDKD